MNDNDEQINTIFVTKKDDVKPILTYDISEKSLAIDLHVQFINFSLGVHHYEISAKDQLGNEKLDKSSVSIDFNKQQELKINLSKDKGISEAVFYIVMNGTELDNVKHLKISVTVDGKYNSSIIIYTLEGENIG